MNIIKQPHKQKDKKRRSIHSINCVHTVVAYTGSSSLITKFHELHIICRMDQSKEEKLFVTVEVLAILAMWMAIHVYLSTAKQTCKAEAALRACH